jgi:two-component system, sporulation sensor kinase E
LPILNQENITEVIEHALKYLRARVSPKVKLNLYSDVDLYLDINRSLFEWVIENMIKNAVDAMNSRGRVDIYIHSLGNQLAIDISDTGKGITKSNFKNVFKAGYTTRKRGWGLGLTLVKRIVENYHQGKIMVLKSAPGEGTTFRILLGRK